MSNSGQQLRDLSPINYWEMQLGNGCWGWGVRPLQSNQLPTYEIWSFLCNRSLGAHLYALTCMGMIGLPGVAHMPLGGFMALAWAWGWAWGCECGFTHGFTWLEASAHMCCVALTCLFVSVELAGLKRGRRATTRMAGGCGCNWGAQIVNVACSIAWHAGGVNGGSACLH